MHVASGDSAAGCLLAARRADLLPGQILSVNDDLSVGPLGDVSEREAFWDRVMAGYTDDSPASDVGRAWSAVQAAADEGADLVVWGGANAAEIVLFDAVCAQTSRLWHVDVSLASHGPHYVAEYRPEDLAGFWPDRVRRVTDAECEARGQEFHRLSRMPGNLRRLELGEIVPAPDDLYDHWLVAASSPEWTPAARVVGTAMGRCDRHNRVGDVYLAYRLQVVVDAGRLEADGPRSSLRSYRVRTPG